MTLPVDQLRLTAMMEDLDRSHSVQSKQQRRDALDTLTAEAETQGGYDNMISHSRISYGHFSSLLDETYRLKALHSEPDQASVPYRKLLEELHRLAAENRTLKAIQTTEAAPIQRLSASWEHLPDVIPTTPTKTNSRETQSFPFAALRKGNQQPVGLLTGFPT